LAKTSYTIDVRGEKFFQIGICLSAKAGMLTNRPICASCPVICSLMYSHRPPSVMVACLKVNTSWP